MAKTISITVHPSPLGPELLTVADAMRQVLDVIDALERVEAAQGSGGKIVWRLQDAHTNSPPFTVVAVPSPSDPSLSVMLEAPRVESELRHGLVSVMDGDKPDWVDAQLSRTFKRIFERNLNGIGHTIVAFDELEPLDIAHQSAQRGLIALERAELDEASSKEDLTHTEFGSIEGYVIGLSRYYSSPALRIQDRLSGAIVICVLPSEVAAKLGPEHKWNEAWEGARVLIEGALHYDAAGQVKKVEAENVDPIVSRKVPIWELRELDLLGNLTPDEHFARFWGDS